MGLVKTILFIILFYYIFKFFMRLLAPFLMKKMADTIQKKAAEQFNNQQTGTVNEGETVIDKAPKKNKTTNKNVGEYVDFEEID